ncbi:type II toxin-antitoxin system VapC family toxin [Candidatus Woesearchaeota archaeon]|nr:type II toxin-antitoxin system VapC family toxin [Candidatus Woesearchaeota archaeon]
MSYDYVVDSYAWVEYFMGTEKGEVVKRYIEKEICATSAITIAEISEKYKREGLRFQGDFNFILSKTKIIDVDSEIAMLSGEISCENKKKIKNWGMADSIILATARMLNARVITGDPHFGGLGAVMLS